MEEKTKQKDEQIDLITSTVLGNCERLDRVEEKLENMVTKQDNQLVMGSLDTLIKLAKKKDEELTMMTHGMRRMDGDINKLKKATGLA